MTLITLFVSATRLAGILVTVTIGANAFSFNRYRKKNLLTFRSPIDESDGILASFNIDGEGENEFFFGLATAPAHVEDKLNDAWLQFAEEQLGESSNKEGLRPADALMGAATGDGGSQQAPLPRTKFNKTGKKMKPLKIVMEAMIRGFQKYIEEDNGEEVTTANEEVHHKVTAWHNVPHPAEAGKGHWR